jgi:hypothetical protein
LARNWEDIAKEQRDGKTVYETDIIKDGAKWEVIVAEDGSIVSKIKEGSAERGRGQGRDGGLPREL